MLKPFARALTSSTQQLQNRSFHAAEQERLRNVKMWRMHVQSVQNCCFFIVKYANLWRFCCRPRRGCSRAWGPFLESPETLRAHFGLHISICIFKAKGVSRHETLQFFYTSYSLYNLWKGQLYRISGSQFYQWLFGPEKFSGLSRNGPLVSKIIAAISLEMVLDIGHHDRSISPPWPKNLTYHELTTGYLSCNSLNRSK